MYLNDCYLSQTINNHVSGMLHQQAFFTWSCNTVLNTLIKTLDVKCYWFTTRL